VRHVTEPSWLNDEEMRIWRAFLASSSGVTSKIDAKLKTTCGISLDDYEVLVHLSEADEQRVRMSNLSDLLLHSRSRLSQRVDRLVGRGFVDREKDENDARGTWAVITTEGLEALKAAAPHHLSDVRSELFAHLAPDELPGLVEILERIAQSSRP
jgi:DNA-binding MarR family transcriptional regulator